MAHIDDVGDYHGRGHVSDEPQPIRFKAPDLTTVLIWLVSALLAYGAVNARIAVLEQRVDSMKSDVSEIKQDMKTLLRRPE